MTLIDITRPMDASVPVWPGDEPYVRGSTLRIRDGAPVNVGWIRLSVHDGTHLDAPYHYRDDGIDVASVPIDDLVGPCVLVEAHGAASISPSHLAGTDLKNAERVLVRTRESRFDPFREGFAHLAPDAARLLAESGVRCFGTDAPSVDPLDSKTLEAHHILATGDVRILENLALWGVPAGRYELVALPLRLDGLDGSPVRAVLREMG